MISVGVRDEGFLLGEVDTKLTLAGAVAVDRGRFLAVLEPLLRDDVLQILRVLPSDGDGRLDLEAVRAAGLDALYDSGLLQIVVRPTPDQRRARRLTDRRNYGKGPRDQDPARFTAFANVRGSLDFIHEGEGEENGLQDPVFAIDTAVNVMGVVIENELGYEPQRVGKDLQRQGSRVVVDLPEPIIRLEAGDISAESAGFQASPELGGISIVRAYRELQPGRSIRSTGQQSFRLTRPSTVNVFVNGIPRRTLRLQAGDFTIADLGLGTGANNVRLEIENDVGEREILDFSLFLDRDLLEEGLDEFGLAVGVRTDTEDGEPEYRKQDPVASGFYRRGLTPYLTGGFNLQGDEDTRLLGLETTWATGFGSFVGDMAASERDGEEFGVSARLGYSLVDFWQADKKSRNFRLQLEARSGDFAIPTQGRADDFRVKASASYSQRLPLDTSGSISGTWTDARGDGDKWSVDLGLSKSLTPSLSIGVTVGYEREDREDEVYGLFSLFYSFDIRNRFSASHDTRGKRSRASYTHSPLETVGALSWDVTLERDDDQGSIDGSVDYAGSRGDIGISHTVSTPPRFDERLDERTRLRAATGIAFAGGKLAFGRPISDSFAIVSAHPNLGNRVVSAGGLREDGARSDFFGPALAYNLQSYNSQVLGYDVDDLPVGYDLGTGNFELYPTYKSGYALTVGTDYTITALGILQDAEGAPVGTRAGSAVELDRPDRPPVQVFTNRAGRFAAQGLRPGRWRLSMSGTPPLTFELLVPEGQVGLYRSGTLKPIPR